MNACPVPLPEHICMTLKIQLLHLKFDFVMLKSSEGLAALHWTCLPLIRSGQNHLAMHCKRGKKTRQTEEKVFPSTREQWRKRKMEETGCEVIFGAPNNPHGLGICEGEGCNWCCLSSA